jgi:hypothetical protein
MRINDFSARSLQYRFVDHISGDSKITTDKWREYRPIAKAYGIKQVDCSGGLNFKALHHDPSNKVLDKNHIFLASDFNINRYFKEFCFSVNRSQSKATIFNNLLTKMVKKVKVYHQQIICK